jgi:hypothetical protein
MGTWSVTTENAKSKHIKKAPTFSMSLSKKSISRLAERSQKATNKDSALGK